MKKKKLPRIITDLKFYLKESGINNNMFRKERDV